MPVRKSGGPAPTAATERVTGSHRPSGRSRIRLMDLALTAWAACWLVLGVMIATEVRGLSDLSRTVTTAGAAVEQTGRLMERLASLPFVGADVARSADQVIEAGRQAQESGGSSRSSVRRLSVLLGVAIAVLPSAPLVLYVPWRLQLARDRRVLRRAVSSGALDDDALLEVLARRGAGRLSYRVLLEVSSDPWGDIRAGRYERLAEAELERVGLARHVRTGASARR
jgi:hypothetical protein